MANAIDLKTINNPIIHKHYINTMELEDPFLDHEICVDRLFNEWKEYGLLIVAFDYDNTIFDYHKKGYKFPMVIQLLQDLKEFGCHLICFTSCDEDRFPEISAYMRENDIPFDSINETPDFIKFTGRKVYYNILLDDRAGLPSAFRQLRDVFNKMRIERHNQKNSKAQDLDH